MQTDSAASNLASPVRAQADSPQHRRLGADRRPKPVTRAQLHGGIPHGAARREAILHYLTEHGSLPLNRKWCLQSSDPDIEVLLKKGLAECKRDFGTRSRHRDAAGNVQMIHVTRTTYLVLKK